MEDIVKKTSPHCTGSNPLFSPVLRRVFVIVFMAFLTAGLVVAIVHVVNFYSRFDQIIGVSRTFLYTGFVGGEEAEQILGYIETYEKAKATAVFNLVFISIVYVALMTLLVLIFISKIKVLSFEQLQEKRAALCDLSAKKRALRRLQKAERLQERAEKLKNQPE